MYNHEQIKILIFDYFQMTKHFVFNKTVRHFIRISVNGHLAYKITNDEIFYIN